MQRDRWSLFFLQICPQCAATSEMSQWASRSEKAMKVICAHLLIKLNNTHPYTDYPVIIIICFLWFE